VRGRERNSADQSGPDADLLWTPPYWAWNDGAYDFCPGYRGPTVGYYGGIDYGYGYTGVSYEGGYWRPMGGKHFGGGGPHFGGGEHFAGGGPRFGGGPHFGGAPHMGGAPPAGGGGGPRHMP